MPDLAPADQLTQTPDGETSWTFPSLAGRPARLSVIVVEALAGRIVSGDYPPGRLLPPEPVLCRSFGVSRSVVREALKVLEQKGLVTVHQGQGTLVADPVDWNLLDPVVLASVVRQDGPRDALDDLIIVRAALEARMAARAATLRTNADLANLRRLAEDLAAAIEDTERYPTLDARLHDEIMRISGNRLARAVVDAIHRQVRSSPWYREVTIEDLRLTHRGHLAILARIEGGDAEGAARAMHDHIISMWNRKRERSTSPNQPTSG